LRVEIGHGSGGRLTRELVEKVFLKHLSFESLKRSLDSALLPGFSKVAFTTDAYVVKPLFFPGGDIGKLSISGTVNDLVVSGASPRFLSASFIIEEGFPLSQLEEIVISMAKTLSLCGVSLVAADTKVVERGKCEGLYITTAGIGEVKRELLPEKISPGDVLIITGSVGEHGVAISLAREEFELESTVESDCAPLNSLLEPLFKFEGLKFMRDATRGGLATVLVETALQSSLTLEVWEEKIPVREDVEFICQMLGYDPLYLANEGKALIVVSESEAEAVLEELKRHPLGRDASIIGRVKEGSGKALLRTKVGGLRRLELLDEDPLPRIC
jgi:hydrogenase expression/formation protein HypE